MKPISWLATFLIIAGGMGLGYAIGLQWDWRLAVIVGVVGCATEGVCLFTNGWLKNPTNATWI